jgi:hypothetical protein
MSGDGTQLLASDGGLLYLHSSNLAPVGNKTKGTSFQFQYVGGGSFIQMGPNIPIPQSVADFTGFLSGDVGGSQVSTVVNSIAGIPAATVASGATAANGASSANAAGAIVKRDSSGNFSAGIITASLNGNASTATSAATAATAVTATSASTATTASTATNFTGSLVGDVVGPQSATVVFKVGGVSASSIASGVNAANSASSTASPNSLVRRDNLGNLAANTITATFSGNGANLTALNASQFSSGTVPDNRLSSNVPLLGAGTNNFTGQLKAAGGLVIESRTSDPPNPVPGQIWLRTDL